MKQRQILGVSLGVVVVVGAIYFINRSAVRRRGYARTKLAAMLYGAPHFTAEQAQAEKAEEREEDIAIEQLGEEAYR